MKFGPTWHNRDLIHDYVVRHRSVTHKFARTALAAAMAAGMFAPAATPTAAVIDAPSTGGHARLRLGDLIWFDTNNDGKHTNDEPGLPGVYVELYRDGQTPGVDVPIQITHSDENGYYVFDGLIAGRYFVHLPKLPSGLLQVTPLDNDASNGKNNRNRGTQPGGVGQPVTSIVFNLQTGQGPTDVGDDANGYRIADIGLWCPPAQGGTLQLGDQVFRDANNNGRRDPDEVGINGITIELYSEGQVPGVNQPLGTDVTKQGGYYTFHNVPAGRYFVYIPHPTAECSTISSQTFYVDDGKNNRNRGKQSNAGQPITSVVMTLDANDGVTDDGDIAGGNLTFDIGLVCVRYAQLGDKVFEDRNANGLQDLGEPGIDGATVQLLDNAGNILQTVVTTNTGLYQFGGLTPGATYKVKVILPDGYTFTAKLGNLNDSNNSDVDTVTGVTDNVVLAAGEINNNVDAGAYRPVRIGNFVWRDLNGNGVYDDGAPETVGVANVVVRLYSADTDTLLATTSTDANGIYLFQNLKPGNYYLIFDLGTLPAGLMVTAANIGSDDSVDSDVNPFSGRTANTGFIASGSEDLTIDMGLKAAPTATPTNTPVTPTNTPTPTPTNTPSTATATPTATNTPSTATATPTATNTPSTATATPTATPTGTAQAFSLGDKVFEDLNNNGLQDEGEPGIAGVTVTLQGPNAVVLTVTDGNGFYQFTNLQAGVPYTVTFTRPNGYQATIRSGNINDPLNSDGDPATGVVAGIVLTQNNTNIDTGFWRPASLGNFVWEDRNGNGTQDQGEPGIMGVTVRLFNAFGGMISTTTNISGFYQFTNLVKGNYVLEFVAPTGYVATVKLNENGKDAVDSDADRNTGRTGLIPLDAGEDDPSNDAGFYRPASLGDRVWDDRNKNGVQDLGEPGISGATVTLYDAEGNEIATTRTDSSGLYQFSNLPPGRYSVGFERPRGGYVFTAQFQGANTGADSNADVNTGRSDVVVLVSGEINPTIDAGMYVPEPDAVTLASFTAQNDKGGVKVKWVTTAEINSLGFRLRRATLSPAGGSISLPDLHAGSVVVTPQMILARGRGQGGATYEFVDTTAQPGLRYVYWLVETELDGTELEYGPTAPSGAGASRIFLPLLTNAAKKR
ncbi:MAG: carboxypeptidase regulatory-like domain-containing protein [Anaerolineae bacterium]|nr:carboxypeptidase regulatory-like domain-containing protein [Anaerolineae bacterium]